LTNRTYPVYLLTKDGFTFSAMGYKGEEATKFKIEYIRSGFGDEQANEL
jgi:Rha family phage regulatory protein